uniref:dihydroorotase n=1 Tax=Paulinella micropora TaxID=1928728 RepID=A0A385HZ93_9EUKA|nr:dihydroorotase [Paulinella micropora]AXY62970.1 dihydroorotase [Paulinella micropora]
MSTLSVTLRQPDDWHVHLRDGMVLSAVAPFTAGAFARAIVMPNLTKPITTVKAAINYHQRINMACKKISVNKSSEQKNQFQPLMTIYLMEDLSLPELVRGYNEKIFTAAKFYPLNVTTNSMFGVQSITAINYLLERMEAIGIPILVHGEVIDPEVDIFDREKVFIDRHLISIHKRFPMLKIVLEHITTADAVHFVESTGSQIAATITPHHLHLNRNAMFHEGIRSDLYCLPVLKRERHRLALRHAATSGNPKFFLGTDSAPHVRQSKETSCGCAGIFNAPYAIESYAQVFEEEGKLELFEGFASLYGPQFYGLPVNENRITLEKRRHKVPMHIHWNGINNERITLVPLHAGENLQWKIKQD